MAETSLYDEGAISTHHHITSNSIFHLDWHDYPLFSLQYTSIYAILTYTSLFWWQL